MREWRKTHPLRGLAREKDITRSYAGVYKRRGRLTPQPCRKCGKRAEMHHADYRRPLKVVWLCREHHLALHKSGHVKQREGALTCNPARNAV
jgi:hypothetical protein